MSKRKSTSTAHVAIREQILALLADGKPRTAREIGQTLALSSISTGQHVTVLLRERRVDQLVQGTNQASKWRLGKGRTIGKRPGLAPPRPLETRVGWPVAKYAGRAEERWAELARRGVQLA
jgi:DNA-binding transcriptional ArsR family regulator